VLADLFLGFAKKKYLLFLRLAAADAAA
jgi:hypothetical protein